MADFKVTFEPMHVVVEVDAEAASGSPRPHGRPGSLLDIALAHGVQVEHACDGNGICGTCAVEVLTGAENLPPADEDELDRIDQVPGSTLRTRLSCQAVPRGDVTVRVRD